MEADDVSKKQMVAAKRNDSAIASLILAFSIDDLIAMILQAQIANWPEGLASNIVK